ncbi:MAG: hypothetical protein KC933_12810 [Myxococcales bacterium]|nr:hypothetical protein [Myxococcales bacterium]
MSGGGPDEVFWSYATVYATSQKSCSGTFIGPNLLLSAGHCGHVGFAGAGNGFFQALLYPEGAEISSDVSINSSCQTLVQNIGLGDTNLLYCEDVTRDGRMEPPGEVLGMADLDPAPLSIGEEVWASWTNPDCPVLTGGDCMGPTMLIYSPGVVTELFPTGSPGDVYGAGGVKTSMVVAKQVSGSSIWRRTAGSHHRIVSSGHTTGACGQDTTGCGGAKAAQIGEVLRVGAAATAANGVNQAKLLSLGLLDPALGWSLSDYQGLYDKDQDGYFDVQTRLDEVRGITARPTFWLGFESPRRNRLWRLPSTADIRFEDERIVAEVDFTGAANTILMELPKVALVPQATYRYSIMVLAHQSPSPSGLKLVIQNTITGASRFAEIPTPTTGGWTMQTGEIQALASGTHRVQIVSTDSRFQGSIAALTLVQNGTTNSFDTFDERMNWRNNTTGARAWILPYGRPSSGRESSWAGLVNDATDKEVDWALRNRQLAIKPGRYYDICFYAKASEATPTPGMGRIQLGDGAEAPPEDGGVEPGTLFLDEEFGFDVDWDRKCITTSEVPVSDNLLQFGHLEGQPEYLIDDVQVVPQ